MRIIYEWNGGVAVVNPCGMTLAEVAAQHLPAGVPFEIVEASALPADRLFRNAWEKAGAAVVESLLKAKLLTHDRRRAKRAAEFAPLDVQATIPAQAAAAETAREEIRNRYAVVQNEIDAAEDVGALRAVIAVRGLA